MKQIAWTLAACVAWMTLCAASPARPVARRAGAALPYTSIAVRVRTRDGQILTGTLSVPRAGIRHPAMLLLSAAEAQDRDASNIHGLYRPFRQLADTLARNGIAVLRLDDRGMGGSSGRLDTLTTAERADDARDALAFLRARREINAARLGVLGHSEGGLIATMLAAEDTSLKALICMATTAGTGRQAIEWIARYAIAQANVLPAVRGQLFQREIQVWRQRIETDRWAAFFDTYDPSEASRRVRTPVLLLQGTADTSCPPDEARRISIIMQNAAGNSDVTTVLLDGYDHAFLRSRDFDQGVPRNDRAYLLSGEVLAPIVSWSVKHLR